MQILRSPTKAAFFTRGTFNPHFHPSSFSLDAAYFA